MLPRTWIAALVVAAIFTGILGYAVIDASVARNDVDGQMSELRAASTRRIDSLNRQLQAEQQEGDVAEATASRYLQQLCDNKVAPYDGRTCK
jgi:hypothetical protein